MYTQIDDEIYAVLIDYKTGKDVLSLDNVEDGFHLQLPAYMYLLSCYEPFQGKKTAYHRDLFAESQFGGTGSFA